MKAEGLRSWFPITDLAVMGLWEVLPKLFHLLGRRAEAVARIANASPHVVITIDSPDFMSRVVEVARKAHPNTAFINYVAPSVWNWRPGRVHKIAKLFDLQLALLPFEPPYFEAVGMPCRFVGHPVVEAIPKLDMQDPASIRGAWRVPASSLLIAVLPGSRASEIRRLGPAFGGALGEIAEQIPSAVFMVPVASGCEDIVREATARWPVKVGLLDAPESARRESQKHGLFAAADFALAASGTATLELAVAGVPTIAAYRLSWLTWEIAKRLVRYDSVSLVNIMMNEQVIPDYLQYQCRPDLLAEAMLQLINDPQAAQRQREAGRSVAVALGANGALMPSARAALHVLEAIESKLTTSPRVS